MTDYLARIKAVLDSNLSEHFVETGRQFFDYLAPDYKHKLSGSFVLVDGNKISEVIKGNDIVVTKKLDGEMRTVFFDGENAVMYTTGGTKQEDFPCLKEFAAKLKASGIKTGGFAAELNVFSPEGKRTRVTDVIHAAVNKSLHSTLALSPFDILFIDNVEWNTDHYKNTYIKLTELFGNNNQFVNPVPMVKVESTAEVQEIYEKWVNKEKAEGLVVHSEIPVIWKVKPQHTIDAAAVGYTSTEDGVRDVLFATIDENNSYRIFASGGNGLADNERKSLFAEFETIKTSSSFVYTDSRGIAFQMIEPKLVFEVTAIDFSAENCMHQANKNKIISYNSKKGWCLEKISPGVSTYSLKIIRLRDDKKSIYEDIRTQQISNICPFLSDDREEKCNEVLLPSMILDRRVYKKPAGKGLYVKKFVILKTNKEHTGKFPAYVLHYSDFSPSRKENLKKKIFVSSNENQLMEIMEDLIFREIDGKWIYVQ